MFLWLKIKGVPDTHQMIMQKALSNQPVTSLAQVHCTLKGQHTTLRMQAIIAVWSFKGPEPANPEERPVEGRSPVSGYSVLLDSFVLRFKVENTAPSDAKYQN
ncbi:hypothetical protein AB205_0173330 [Aquarana catesbeiana]|uniref:Uncharacterized protein n=1 Tax=Aquarana catesbeiana TaxID=8400 RepID=A0A2G9SHE8_AQUCT|nr:hypothetical protein AB205_0173330 [Aquarana catesbeiana]